MTLNSNFDSKTPKPEFLWLNLSSTERVAIINDKLTQLSKSNKVICTRALSNGEIYLKIMDNIPVAERLDFFLDLEMELKKSIDEALFISCEPLGDKSSLRNLRGIQVKMLNEN